MSLSKLQEIVHDMEAWHAAVHKVAKSCSVSNGTTTTVSSGNVIVIVSHFDFNLYFSKDISVNNLFMCSLLVQFFS